MGCGSGAPCVRTVRAPPLSHRTAPPRNHNHTCGAVGSAFNPAASSTACACVGAAATLAHEVEQMHEAQVKVEYVSK